MSFLIGLLIGMPVGVFVMLAIVILAAFEDGEKEELSKEDWKAGYRQK